MERIQQLVWRVDGFRQVVEECELRDLGFTGSRFTWERHRNTRNWVCERLDRVLTTSQWVLLFPKAQVHHLEVANSDHSALFLSLGVSVIRYAPVPFRFENAWLKEIDIEEAVLEAWSCGREKPIGNRIAICGNFLKE
ncbi:uncharacterized protein LOC107818377 [Nicotiana tabacum]|uniref:Uncharacterized protein LOC107818377 n=1 Tax=Nicotiana tabacum TaxID=4097 RepID=A0A1S4CFC1_TOBAC|nr:PREDICTED: uncharacterized protein LOC107818377 [Nicotiana tabacum]